MPFKSQSQQRYFHYLESKGKMPKKTVKEFDESTNFEHLPEEVDHESDGGMMHNYADGGMVDEECENEDEEQGEMDEYVSSGEPHTEDHMEDEEPMEYMSRGGKVRRMANGGMAHRSEFAKALRKGY